jgi:predicted transcriptional regulator
MTLPKASQSVNTDLMTEDEIHAKLQEGYDDIKAGKVLDAEQGMQNAHNLHICILKNQVCML